MITRKFVFKILDNSIKSALLLFVLSISWSHAKANSDTYRVKDSLSQLYAGAILEEIKTIDYSKGLEEYLKFAENRSPALRSAYFHWKSAMEKTGYTGAFPDPMFSYGKFIENVETRVGPQNQRFSLKQSLPWFGTLGAKKQVSIESANAAYRQYESERLKLFYKVKAAYYEYYFLGQNISLTKENLELLKFWESVVRTKYKAALKQHPDVIKVQVELGRLEDHLISLEDQTKPAIARLLAAMNLPDTVVLPIPQDIQPEEIALNQLQVTQEILVNNPNLNSMQHLVDKEIAGVRLAGKSYFPSFSIGIDYIETGPAINPAMSESGKDPWIIGVGVNLPVWIGKNKSIKGEAIARQKQAEYNYLEARNQLRSLIEKVLFEYNDAIRKIRLYRDGLVPKAEQSLNVNYAAYQSGELDFLNVLDAQRVLLEFQLKLERARADLATIRAEIEMLMGKSIDAPFK